MFRRTDDPSSKYKLGKEINISETIAIMSEGKKKTLGTLAVNIQSTVTKSDEGYEFFPAEFDLMLIKGPLISGNFPIIGNFSMTFNPKNKIYVKMTIKDLNTVELSDEFDRFLKERYSTRPKQIEGVNEDVHKNIVTLIQEGVNKAFPTQQAGSKPTQTLQKTNLRVQINGQTRVVYLNKYKTQYVKYKNEYIPLSKAKKLEKSKQ